MSGDRIVQVSFPASLERVAETVRTICLSQHVVDPEFYGNVQLNFKGGEIANANVTRSIKP